jgi:O-antigen ligase
MTFAFGTVGIYAQMISLLPCWLIILLSVGYSVKTDRPFFTRNIFYYLFLSMLGVIFLQLISLPKFLLEILSPATYKYYLKFLSGYKEYHLRRPISVCPESTAIEFFKILSYGAVGLVIMNNFSKKSQIIRLLTVISIIGFIAAVFGIIQKFTWNGMIYWVQPVAKAAMPFGPFVNKNYFAGLMELTIPIAAAFIFIQHHIAKRILFGFMACVMLLALFLSFSRAGIVSFFIATLIILSCLLLRRSFKKYFFYIIPFILLVSILTFFVATTKEPLLERFSNSSDGFLERWNLYKDGFRMFLDFPIFGVGLSNFNYVFSSYDSAVYQTVFISVHNDWLQFLIEAGLVGFLFIAVFIWIFFKDILFCHFLGVGRCVFSRDINLRHSRFVLVVMLTGLISITSIILHGFLDINLHIPSNGILAYIIVIISIIAAHNIQAESSKHDNHKL